MKRLAVIVIAALAGSTVGNTIRTSFLVPDTGGTEGRESELIVTGSVVGTAVAALAGLLSRRWGWAIAFVAAAAVTATTGAELDQRVAGLVGARDPIVSG